MKIKRDYFTLEEAADLSGGLSLRDIHHFIETGKITPVLYTQKRLFIATRPDPQNKQRIALATCSYRGLLYVHKSWIEALLDKKKIIVNKAGVALNPSAITNWNSSNPFKGEPTSLGFNSWITNTKHSDTGGSPLSLIPLPSESDSIAYMVQQLTKKIQPDYDHKKNAHNIQRYTYSFNKNGTFSYDDLRLLPSHIETLIKPDSEPKSLQSNPITDKSPLPWVDSQKGGSLVNEPLERLFRQNPHQPAKIYWRLLRDDFENYDPDKIIDSVTNAEIHWFTRSDEQKTMIYKTFENKISKIRTFYKENPAMIDN